MSSLAHSLVSWSEFQQLPERPESAQRYELHDGEVVAVPPAKPIHIKIQRRIEKLLESIVGDWGVVTKEFPYRPQPNLQFWVSDVACLSQAHWDSMPSDEYPVFAPPLVIEVLSPSNTPAKTSRQRIVALSSGTEEFWVVDPIGRSVTVTRPSGTTLYRAGDMNSVLHFETPVSVDAIFA